MMHMWFSFYDLENIYSYRIQPSVKMSFLWQMLKGFFRFIFEKRYKFVLIRFYIGRAITLKQLIKI